MLKAVKTITLPPAMQSEAARKVMTVLNPKNDMQQTLFVGGCVRNALLDMDVEDVDMATLHEPQEVMAMMESAGIKTIPTGLDHGTVTAVLDDQSFEITTLRKDVKTDGRHAVVEFSKDWKEDAQRRDFTMNTLLADLEGSIFDPLGAGVKDLEARVVRFVGNAEQRIQEDYLRILRFFRFHVFYGEGDLHAGDLAACRKFADQISTLSRERITQEFFKILSVDDPTRILRIMFKNNVLEYLFSSENQLVFLEHFCTFQIRYGLNALAPRLFVLAELDMDKIPAFEKQLLIPKVFKRDMEALTRALTLPDLSNDQAVRIAVYKCGRTIAAQALMMELVQDRVMNGYAPQALEIIRSWDIPMFPLSGEDLMKEGFTPSPALGTELAKREEEWIKNGFKF